MDWASFKTQDFDLTNLQFHRPKITESEWLTSKNFYSMVACLPNVKSPRKLRLFACASVRQIWHLITDDRARKALDVAEMFADGLVTPDELVAANHVAFDAYAADSAAVDFHADWGLQHKEVMARGAAADAAAPDPPTELSILAAAGLHKGYWNAHLLAQLAAADPHFDGLQAAALRDLFGNPFSPVVANQSWLTPPVNSLAEHMYVDRDFLQMPDLEE